MKLFIIDIFVYLYNYYKYCMHLFKLCCATLYVYGKRK